MIIAAKTVSEFSVGERLDKVLATAFPQYSRSLLSKLINDGLVHVNDARSTAKYKLKQSDKILVDFSILEAPVPQIDIPILYEDADVVVLNKPAGVLTHAKGNLHNEATVATFIQPRLSGTEAWKSSNRAGIVHRLDRATSGVMICAKTESSAVHLQKQFASRKVKKIYVAVVEGRLPEPAGLIDVPIERNPKKPATFQAGRNGKVAQTGFTSLRTNNLYSLIELSPITGRTHQLRVHLAFLKHPIVGDEVYKGATAPRLLLHAHQIELTLPSKERRKFIAKLPAVFTEYIDD